MSTASERDRIMRTAHAALDRLRDLQPSEPPDPAASDRLEQWRRGIPKPEPAPRKRGLDTAPVDWDARIAAAVSREHELLMDVLAQAFRETFRVERDAISAALSARDAKIALLETELAKQAAQTARLEVRVISNEIERDRDRSDKLVDVSPKLKVVN
jgi:hypothetical protein